MAHRLTGMRERRLLAANNLPQLPTELISFTPECRRGFVAIGNFDGVHRGHQAMMALLAQRARELGGRALAMTFDPHPWELLRPSGAPPSLMTLQHRVELLKRYGADEVLVCRTTHELLRLSASDFFQQIIIETLNARGLIEGPNFFFGREREGNITLLKQLCEKTGLSLDIVPPILVADQLVSSSVIRSLLSAGQMKEAVDLLGHPYQISGLVGTGMQRGRTIGFPTANLTQCPNLIPAHGVYSGRVRLDRNYPAAIHIGPNPTFGEQESKIEVHILDFTGDLYGQMLSVDLQARIRGVTKFADKEALLEQLHRDCQEARAHFANPSIHEG